MAFSDRLDRVVLVSPAGLFSPLSLPTLDDTASAAPPQSVPLMLRALDTAWSANVTPFQLLRMRGLVMQDGQKVVTKLLRRRFNNRFAPETNDLIAEYLWHTTALPGSGEFAMNSLLQPVFAKGRGGVYARQPIDTMMERLPKDVDVLAVFGDSDWLAPTSEMADQFKAKAKSAGLRWQFGITPEAGHHLYIENPSYFNQQVRRFTTA